ncbi:hypothetical protein PHMEG_00019963 [Phytophthora megakarya]|uniref:HTH CENPB-type domain-containing protein n=1 Tax=Phytophthora megakarya TaxID=4795 RepID=A0A225VQ09_9STRA|nr:hypothetical protein PHMEG_00019963 [Phytophthora megakarya]
MARTPAQRTPGQSKGRIRTSGASKAPKQLKRVSITYNFTRSAVEFYDALVSKGKMQITPKKRQIYNWLDQRELIVEKCKTGCGSHCNDRSIDASATLPREVEQKLKEGVPVTGSMVRMQAKECYDSAELQKDQFAASHTWLCSFLRRNELSIRRRTHQSQNLLKTQPSKQKISGKKCRKRSINYEYLPSQTIELTGSKTVGMKSARRDKDRITLMLLRYNYDTEYDPFLFF